MTGRRSTVAAVVVLLLAATAWWVQSGSPLPGVRGSDRVEQRLEELPAGSPLRTDPDSGLPVVGVRELPPEARDTIALIVEGGPFPYEEDGDPFGNYEGLLPDHERGYYREYTVDTPGSDDRGARRIIQGGTGELYWTADHYASFERIAR